VTVTSMPQPTMPAQQAAQVAEDVILGVDTHKDVHVAAVITVLGAQCSIAFWVVMNTGPSAPPISTRNTTAATGSVPAAYRPSMPTACVATAAVSAECGKRSSNAPVMLTPARHATLC
jgi:hypothetical protein